MAEEEVRYYQGTGRRKEATARVRLYPGDGSIIVNDAPVKEYFSRQRDVFHLTEPLKATTTQDSFDVTVKVQGGGISGQAGAVRHGIARALLEADPDLRPTLRKA
ncbi:MAG: 30S ribosomal protein S9, partial [Anaerolineae bacterium]